MFHYCWLKLMRTHLNISMKNWLIKHCLHSPTLLPWTTGTTTSSPRCPSKYSKKIGPKTFSRNFSSLMKTKTKSVFFSRQLKFQSCTWKSDIKIGVFDVTNRLVLNFFLTLFSILELTNSSSSGVSMQALRLLVNLSTNPPMIEYLQSADVSHDKSSKYFYRLNKAL